MRVEGILNNNAVLSQNNQGEEIIIVSKGIGFASKVGDSIDKTVKHKIFTLKEDEFSRHFKKLIVEIPFQVFEVCEEIVQHTKNKLNRDFKTNLLVTLSDHIHGGINRIENGIALSNFMIWDAKLLYPEEFDCAMWGCKRIKEKLGYDFNEDEAAIITMHIVNAGHNWGGNFSYIITEMQGILKIIKYRMMTDINHESLSYYRFMIHLKLLIQRILAKENVGDKFGQEFYEDFKRRFKREYACVEEIRIHLNHKFNYRINEEEAMYLVLHINRLMKSAEEGIEDT
ncbi:MAG: PRD domain-containing protein [Clostridiales bacterium]|nr:PRD domain-containing protein [Clostridiales bacterium]